MVNVRAPVTGACHVSVLDDGIVAPRKSRQQQQNHYGNGEMPAYRPGVRVVVVVVRQWHGLRNSGLTVVVVGVAPDP